MYKRFLTAVIAAAASIASAFPATAGARDTPRVKIEASVYGVTDNSIFADVRKSISKLPGAKLVMEGQSDNAAATAVQAWFVDTGTDPGSAVKKALTSFEITATTQVDDIVPTGRTLPMQVGVNRDYVRNISFVPGRDRKEQRVVETSTVSTGSSFRITPSIRKDGVHLSFEQNESALTGPDEGFRNVMTKGGVIQLKQVSESSLKFEDIHMPKQGKSLVLLRNGIGKNEYIVTVIQATQVH
jgi:hypothetical protein